MRSNYQDFLVDRKGDFIVPNSSQWLRTFRGTIEGISAKRYAVVNLGWISINVQPKAIHIELRVASVSPVSLAALIFWLSELEAHRTVLTIHREKETYELFANHHALRDRLVGILREVEMRGHDRFERHTIGWNNKSQISSFERLNKMWRDRLSDACAAFPLARLHRITERTSYSRACQRQFKFLLCAKCHKAITASTRSDQPALRTFA